MLRINDHIALDQGSSVDHAPLSSAIRVDLEWVIKEHKDSVWCARFSPDGRYLCTCSSDKTAKVWDLNSRTLVRTFDSHSDTVWSCCYAASPSLLASPGGVHVIATGSSDKTVKIWHAESGEVLLDLDGYGDAVDSLDFSSDSELLSTSCRNGVVKIWTNLSLLERLRVRSASVNSASNCSEPIYLDLTYVSRGASRFSMFSNVFSSYLCKIAESHPSTQGTDRKDGVTISSRLSSEDANSQLDHNELFFAGGPGNYISVWRVGDIVRAFEKTRPSERDKLSRDIGKSSSSERECIVSLSAQENAGTKGVPSCLNGGMSDDGSVTQNNESSTSLNNGDCDESGEGKHVQSFNLVDQQSLTLALESTLVVTGTQQLETITEVAERDDVSPSLSNHSISVTTGQLEEAGHNSERMHAGSGSTSSIVDSSVISYEESTVASYVSDELFAFYKLDPKWTLTDHLNTVWGCCTAKLHDVSGKDEACYILISCSGDRTLR